MTRRETKHEIRLREWSSMVKQRQESGLTIDEWCMQHDLKPSCYYYRLAQLRKAVFAQNNPEPDGIHEPAMPTLVKVEVTSSEQQQRLALKETGEQFFHLQYKRAVLDIPVGTEAEDIAEVLKAMAQYAV